MSLFLHYYFFVFIFNTFSPYPWYGWILVQPLFSPTRLPLSRPQGVQVTGISNPYLVLLLRCSLLFESCKNLQTPLEEWSDICPTIYSFTRSLRQTATVESFCSFPSSCLQSKCPTLMRRDHITLQTCGYHE